MAEKYIKTNMDGWKDKNMEKIDGWLDEQKKNVKKVIWMVGRINHNFI